ncbi:MAG: hypothetical protein SO073_07205, partial [Candidatus Onthomonas sp.]|nr:hypothetical protein [Candidatus Onthomonas sp.]
MYGVIDIGSNTIRMVVYRVGEAGAIHPVLNKKYATGLVGYINGKGRMSKEGIRKAVEILRELKEVTEQIRLQKVFPFATDASDTSMDTTETVEPTDSNEIAESAETAEPVETTESTESAETAEPAEAVEAPETTEPAEATNPTTDEEILAALETYDDSIDDPEYQRAYEAHQKWLEQQDSPQTFATGANPYTGKTYTHKHEKTNYIYDGIDVSKWQGTSDWKKVK